jgi:hypothetical protein
MSKFIGSPLMYSGMQNPQRDLTEEEVAKIKELVSQLSVTCAAHNPSMGFTGYAVNNEENWYVSGSFYGQVIVFENNGLTAYKDTAGVTAYLHLILGHLVQEHLEEHEKMSGTS